MDIRELHKEGHSVRAIARLTGFSRNTIRRVLRGEHPGVMQVGGRASKLDPFWSYVKERYQATGLSAVRLVAEIRPMGYTGSVDTVRRQLRDLRGEVVRRSKLTVRFETPPGKQAQADWTYCGKFDGPNGTRVSIYAFVIVLGFSRQMFIHFTTSMRMPELLRCHQLAFEFFGGWPEQILYDNMKQVRLSPSRWNEQFLDFAGHYGFVPKTHRPYRPRTKGKVERSVDYVKDNFLRGRSFDGLEDLNTQARHWLDFTANVRVHATTGQRPCDLFREETLTPITSAPAYRYIDPVKRTVSFESMVRFEGSRYSVPPAFAGKAVEVVAEGGQILVRAGDMIVAEHKRAARAGQCIVQREHLAELWRLTQEQTPLPDGVRWQVRFHNAVEVVSLERFDEVAP